MFNYHLNNFFYTFFLFSLLFLYSIKSFAQSVSIGKQIWYVKNLNVNKFKNGDLIPQVKTNKEWERFGNEGKAAWCYYDNDPTNANIYGKLYNWFAVVDPRGLAPDGFHVPSDDEWSRLIDTLGGEDFAGTFLKSNSGWNDVGGKNGNGNNETEFNAFPSGYRTKYGSFYSVGISSAFWSTTQANSNHSYSRFLNEYFGSINQHKSLKQDGFSVRVISDQ